MKRNYDKDQVRGFIVSRALFDQKVITCNDICFDFDWYCASVAVCSDQMPNRQDISKFMKSLADDYGYTFRFDGKDAQGKFINARLVEKGYTEQRESDCYEQ